MKKLLDAPAGRWGIRLALGVFVVALLLARAKPEQFLDTLKRVSPLVPFAAVLFYWLAQCLSALKWQILLQARGAHFSFLECARLYLLGMFCSLFLPTTIGGDGVRALITGPKCGGTMAAASSILVERLTGLVALLTIGAIGVALWGTGSSGFGINALWQIFVILALAALGFAVLRATAYRLERAATGKAAKVIGKWASLHREIDFYAQPERRKTLVFALGISFIFQSAQVAINIFLARATGLQAPITTFLWLVPLLSLMSMIPIGIGGLGVREAAAVAVLGNQALAWSLMLQATVWLSSLPGALFLGEWRRSRQSN